MSVSPQYDTGRQRRRPSDRLLGGNGGSLKSLPYDHPDFPHGRAPTDTGYPTGYFYGCRCETCVKANGEYMAEWRRRTDSVHRAATDQPYVPASERQVEHGTRWCYVRGCRQPECVQANRDYQREYMKLHRQGIKLRDEKIETAMRT